MPMEFEPLVTALSGPLSPFVLAIGIIYGALLMVCALMSLHEQRQYRRYEKARVAAARVAKLGESVRS